jgi:hypothetical protein
VPFGPCTAEWRIEFGCFPGVYLGVDRDMPRRQFEATGNCSAIAAAARTEITAPHHRFIIGYSIPIPAFPARARQSRTYRPGRSRAL